MRATSSNENNSNRAIVRVGFAGATLASENIRLSFGVPPSCVEYRYTYAEYALVDASVKQNNLSSSPPMYLWTGSDDSGRRSPRSFPYSSCCRALSVSSRSNSCCHSS